MWRSDVRFALRTLRKTWVVTAAAVLCLALGIGLNTAIFSVVQSVLLNQLPYREPDRIVALSAVDSAHESTDRVGSWLVDEWRHRSRSLELVSVFDDSQLNLTESGEAEVLRGMRVSHEYFETLGVDARLGRTFARDEDRARPAPVIVLTHGLWVRRFGADPVIVGRMIEIDGRLSYRVIGVLPASFHPLRMSNPAESPQYFAPAPNNPQEALACRGCIGQRVIARLRRGINPTEAQAELDNLTKEIARQYPADFAQDINVRVEPLMDKLVAPLRPAIWALFGAVFLVLLIACASVASLQIARGFARSREFAVRAALGGSRSRIVTQLLVESLLMAVLGGAAGIAIGFMGTSAIASWAPRELPRLEEIHVDGRVLVFTACMTLMTGILFGIAPAWSASGADARDALEQGGGATSRSTRGRVHDGLIVVNIALAFVLVIVTGLLARSVRNIRAVDAGFNSHDVLTMTPVVTPIGRYATAAGRLAYLRQLMDTVRGVSGVTSVGMISNVPLSHSEPARLRTDTESSLSDADAPTADVFWVSGDYFRALEIPLRRGRLLTDHDGGETTPAVLISESLAKARFPGARALGRRIQLGWGTERGPWAIVVGIVGDVRYGALDRQPGQAVYEPQAMNPFHYTRLVVRTSGDPRRFETPIRSAIHDLDPLQPVFHVQPMDDYIASSISDRSFAVGLIAPFGGLALLLAAVGLYGLMSYSVGLRTAEIGIRVALGATSRSLVTLVLRQGLALTGTGIVLGLVCGLATTRLLGTLLFGVNPLDPGTLVAAVVVLLVTSAAAAYLPARAATRLSPVDALK